MGNCLVTKLKERVDNNNLRTLDELLITVKAGNSINLDIFSGEGVYFPIKVKTGDGYIDTVGTTNKDVSISANVYAVNSDTVFSIGDKYNLAKLNITTGKQNWEDGGYVLDMSELTFLTKLAYLSIQGLNNTIGKIDFSRCPLTYFDYTNKNNTIKMSDIAVINPGHLEVVGLSATSVSGNISEIVNQTALTALYMDSTAISGEITVLLDAMKVIRPANSKFVFNGNGIITLNGTVVADAVIRTVTFDGQGGYSVA